MKRLDTAVGACPFCKKKTGFFYNDMPLKVFCWGPEQKPHKQWSKIVPEIKQCNTNPTEG
jgi:hypothetical protein